MDRAGPAVDVGEQARTFSAQIDPADASHFTLPMGEGVKHGALEGWFDLSSGGVRWKFNGDLDFGSSGFPR